MKQREGYLLIDHRASPGIPAEMALKLGMDPTQVGEGKLLEAATLTCAHCKSTVLKRHERTRERGSCPKCSFKYVCDGCAIEMRLPGYSHTPFEKKVDEHKDREAKGVNLDFLKSA